MYVLAAKHLGTTIASGAPSLDLNSSAAWNEQQRAYSSDKSNTFPESFVAWHAACITSLSKMHGIMIHHLFGSWSAESPISSCPSPACFCVRRWKYGGCCGLAVDFEQRAGKTQIPIAKSELDSWCSHQIGHWIMWSSPWSRRSIIDDLCGNIVKENLNHC